MSALEKLVEIAGPALGTATLPDGIPPLRALGALGMELESLLRMRNGFVVFESALHVFFFGQADGVLDVETWNAPSTSAAPTRSRTFTLRIKSS